MILIVGGEGAGKEDYVNSLGYANAQCSFDPHADVPVCLHAERLVKTQDDVPQLLPLLLQKEVVVCNEVGSGIIPAEPERILWREAAGRLSVLLAKEASCVVRLVCGIPAVLKGEAPCTIK